MKERCMRTHLSGEIRWFWTKVPTALQEWFTNENIHECRPGGGPLGRKDVYLPGNDRGELRIKARGESGGNDDDNASPGCSDVEMKGLVAVDWEILNFPLLPGPVEIWCKWPFHCLDMGKTRKCELEKDTLVTKIRHQRGLSC